MAPSSENNNVPSNVPEDVDVDGPASQREELPPAAPLVRSTSQAHSTVSGSTVAPRSEKESHPQESPANQVAVGEEVDPLGGHLMEDERNVLKRQLEAEETEVSYLLLYRYATRMDILIIVVSSICAIAAGVALPLMTVCFDGSRSLASAAQYNDVC